MWVGAALTHMRAAGRNASHMENKSLAPDIDNAKNGDVPDCLLVGMGIKNLFGLTNSFGILRLKFY